MKNYIKANMYVKDIYDINYDKLKKMGITTLFFDLDNTLLKGHEHNIDEKRKTFLNKLQKDFKCLVISNSLIYFKVKRVCNDAQIDYIWHANKPFTSGFKRGLTKLNVKNNEVCVIGDQLYTDIKGAKKMGFYSVLIDPISKYENIFTRFNRLREKKIFKRGNYYE